MLAYPLVLSAFLAGSANAVSRNLRREFIRAMRQQNLDPNILADVSKTSRSLTKKIKDSATFIDLGRKLEDEQAYGNANQAQNNKNYNYNKNYVNGNDDYFAYNKDMDWENIWGFDASQYSLSYERCSTVKHFDLEKAAEEDSTSPFRTQHFAVLRLCPAKTCDNPYWYVENDDNVEGAENSAQQNQAQNQQNQAQNNGAVYGANGSGCSSNYATFLLDAGKYLSIMAEYEDTQFEMYCDYCDTYMQKQYTKWVQNGGRRLEFEDFMNDSVVERMLGGQMASCKVYYQPCNNGGFDDDYEDYLTCNEVDKNNGAVAYTQATCAEDGQTMTIGIYSDEECTVDISSQVNIANWIGEEIDDEAMEHYYKKTNSALAGLIESYGGTTSVDPNSVCLRCKASDQDWFLEGDDDGSNNQGEIADVCDAVFLHSARCDKTLSNWYTHARNSYYAESNALQEISCAYIDAMRMGRYDAEGNVVMDKNRLYNENSVTGIASNLYYQEYGQGLAEVSPLQYCFLILSILTCVILAVWSTTLHKSLTKNGVKWRPRRGVRGGTDHVEMYRQDSGVVLGRSQSNGSYYLS